MPLRLLVRRCATVACAGLLALTAACQGTEEGEEGSAARPVADRPPPFRADGERLPAFSGADPLQRGWTKVDGLLWIQEGDRAAYENRLVFDGTSYVPFDRPIPPGSAAAHSYRLRTDHVAIHTNASWNTALDVAREAEAHVRTLVAGYGEALDLRVPYGPLKIVVTASRQELAEILADLVQDPIAWGAFYDARSGSVYMSMEPAPKGALPWQADLRHEMTHQVLDLSRPAGRRGRAFPVPWFWLWEGFAVWSESLGGDRTATEARLGRFRRRYAWNEWVPLATLVRLPQSAFTGRHYDQAAPLMAWMLDASAERRRAGVLDLVRRLQFGTVPDDALEKALGMSFPAAEASWRATVGR